MDRYLQLTSEEQRLYCEQTAARLGYSVVAIEKDFWVCWTLRELFRLSDWGANLTFKGGTSLSKAWKLIERFSEDIDIVIDREFLGFGSENSPEQAPSKKKIDKRLVNLKETCRTRIHSDLLPALLQRFESMLPPEMAWDLNLASVEEAPDGQTLLFQYPTILQSPSTYLRPVVKIELGARSDHEPSSQATIQPYIAEVFPQEFPDSVFQVMTLTAERTFLEKAMLLHEETYRPAGKTAKNGMARHYYDLWVMITKGVGEKAIQDPALFHHIADHRQIYFKWGWMDYDTLKPGSMRLTPLDSQMDFWRQDYQDMRREMFAGDVPDFDDMMKVIKSFEVAWNNRN